MQTENLFELTYILLEKKQVTAREMSAHFGVSQRTIYRWVDALNLAGVPIYSTKGKGGGICISEKYVLDKTVFTEDEKLELLAGVRTLENLSGNKASAVTKLKTLTKANADWIQIDFAPWNPKMTEIRDFFNLLKCAVLNGKKVQFEYFSMGGKCSTRKVSPWKIVFRGQAWYLFGYCYLKEENRYFRLSRMKNLVMLAESVEQSVSILKNKNVEVETEKYSGYSGYMEDSFPEITLKLKVQDSDIYRILDEYKAESVEPSPDGDESSKIMTLKIREFPWLGDYILSFGSRISVIEPQKLKCAVINEIKKMNAKT